MGTPPTRRQERRSVVDRRDLLREIIERELKMFVNVRNEGGTADCQKTPDAFRLMREMTLCVQSDAVLASYLQDLVRAETEERNLMTEKYARMDNRIPPLKSNEAIGEIVDAESRWRDSLRREFPHVLLEDGRERFRRYLSCELETWSDQTLEGYRSLVTEARKQGRNLARERYELLMERLGFRSLAAYERALRENGRHA